MAQTLKGRKPQVAKNDQIVEVQDLTGGVNLRVSPTLIDPDQARNVLNWSLDTPGELGVHPGYLQFSQTSLGAGRAQGGRRIYLSSHTFTLLAHNSTLYTVTDGGVASTVLSGLSTRQIYFPYDRDMVAVLDGVNRPKKSTDGSTWTNFGIIAPTTCVTPSTLSSGACSSGEYEFAFSFKDRSLSYESNISSGSTVYLTGTTGAFHLVAGSSFAQNDVQADAYVWYGRDVTAGESVFRKISSGTASTLRVTDTNWTANDEAPTNHDVLMKGAFGVVWKNRWWVVDPDVGNRLRFSEIFLPQAFPALFFIDSPFERGDSIAAIVPLGDTLVVFGQSRVFLVIGQTSLDFEVRPSAGSVAGALGPRAVDVIEQGAVHASAEGIHIFDGASDKLLTHLIEPGWRDYISNASGAELQKTAMVYEFRRKCLRVAVSRLYPTGAAGEWELNLDRTRVSNKEAWTKTDRAIGGYIHLDGNEPTAGLRGELISWSDTTGLLFKESTGTTANSSNMVATYEGPTLSLGLHTARVLDLHVEYEPHGGSLTEETLVDNVSQGALVMSIGSAIALWGSAVWGSFVWGGSGRRKAYRERPLTADGRTITQRFIYSGRERFRIFTYAFTVKPEKRPRTFTE
jgi:hypothetical protein